MFISPILQLLARKEKSSAAFFQHVLLELDNEAANQNSVVALLLTSAGHISLAVMDWLLSKKGRIQIKSLFLPFISTLH